MSASLSNRRFCSTPSTAGSRISSIRKNSPQAVEETQDLYFDIHADFLTEDGLFGEEGKQNADAGSGIPVNSSAIPQTEMLPIDFEAALYRFGDDRVFMMELCSEFIAGLPARLADIHAAVEAKDANSLGRLGHNMKGIALNFDAEPWRVLP